MIALGWGWDWPWVLEHRPPLLSGDRLVLRYAWRWGGPGDPVPVPHALDQAVRAELRASADAAVAGVLRLARG